MKFVITAAAARDQIVYNFVFVVVVVVVVVVFNCML
jgi:hypothetical protein